MNGQSQRRYNVQIFAVVRVDVANMPAASCREAVNTALRQIDLASQVGSNAEYAGELSHFVVDLVGDKEFRQSESFTSQDQPLLANMARLLNWAEHGRNPLELERILHDARAAVADSI